MDEKQLITLQKIVLEYFDNTSDEDFIAVVDSYVYVQPAKNDKISKLVEKFLKDNGILLPYLNYISDQRDKNKYLNRCSMSDTTIVEGVKWALLNAAFNRLRNATNEVKLRKKVKVEHSEMKRLISTLMDAGTNDRYHETLDEMRDLAISWEK